MKNIALLNCLLKYLLLFLFIITIDLHSQTYQIQAFSHLVPDSQYPSFFDVMDSHYRNDPNQLFWDPYYSSIPVLHVNLNSAPPNLAFQGAIIDTEMTDDMNQWNKYGCKQMQFDNSNVYGVSVPIAFSDNQQLFPNGAFAFTALAVQNIGSNNSPKYATTLYSSFSQTLFNQTEIFLNSGVDPAYTWSTDTIYIDDYTINLKYIILHEMGHLLGLGHRDKLPYDSVAVMNQNVFAVDRKPRLTQYDIQGIQDLCNFNGYPTGIEDYIIIYYGPTQVTQNSNVTYAANFVDQYPYGDYIPSANPYNWQIVLHSAEGDYSWASASLPTIESWQVNLGNIPNEYGWLRDQNNNILGDVVVSGIDDKGILHTTKMDIKLSGVPPNTTAGTLSHSETWFGTNRLTDNVTVPVGDTLKILKDAIIKIPNGKSLTINGTLLAQGNNYNQITFDTNRTSGIWGSIIFNGSSASSSIMDNVVINNGGGIQSLNYANTTIQNSIIKNCSNGIYIYNASPSISGNQILNPSGYGIYIDAIYSSPVIKGNLIKSTTGYNGVGIEAADNALPYISNNKIGGLVYGIYTGGGSITYFTDAGLGTPSQNNLVTGNLQGVVAAWGSTINGGLSNAIGGNNSIHDNYTYDGEANNSGALGADYDYWGTNPKRSWDGSSTITYDYALSGDPWNGVIPSIRQNNNSKKGNSTIPSAEVASVITPNPVVPDTSSTDPFVAFNLEKNGDINGAIAQYMKMIANDSHADLAITELFRLSKKYSRTDVSNYFGSFSSSNKHYTLVSKLIADNNLQTGKFDQAISTYDNLIKTYPNDYYGINARFQKLFAYENIKNDNTSAQQMLTQIKTMNLTDPFWLSQTRMAENLLGSSSKAMVKKSVDSTEITLLPKEYFLDNNYPNPFNPSTTINYQIPNNNYVTLKVYDILGNVVKTLVDGYKTQGKYSVNFNADNLASGVYFYRLSSGSFTSIKKMVLLK